MGLVSTRAVVLQAFPYSDTSKILRLLTPELGLRSVIAKGARRPRSRFGALLEPFTDGIAQFYLREGRDLHSLSGFDLLRSRQGIGRDLTAFAGASLLSEVVLRCATEEAQPRLFAAVAATLDDLSQPEPGTAPARSLRGLWELVALLGFEPQLGTCVHCGRPPGPTEPTRFDVPSGGVACTRCRPTGRVLDAVTRKQVAVMAASGPAPDAPLDLPLHRALLRAFLSTHLAPEQPLRALELYLLQLR